LLLTPLGDLAYQSYLKPQTLEWNEEKLQNLNC